MIDRGKEIDTLNFNVKLCKRAELNNYGGVYILLLEGEPVYVGKSSNPLSRIMVHHKKGKKDFDSYFILTPKTPVNMKTVSIFETILVLALDPPLNGIVPSNPYMKTRNGIIEKIYGGHIGLFNKVVRDHNISEVYTGFYLLDEENNLVKDKTVIEQTRLDLKQSIDDAKVFVNNLLTNEVN